MSWSKAPETMYRFSRGKIRIGNPCQGKCPAQRCRACKPRIGLALSGGGVKAVAHIGVLQAFRRAGLEFDLVAGTSAGALAGLYYCDGHEPKDMFQILRDGLRGGGWWRWLPGGKYWRLSRLFKKGILRKMMESSLRVRRFEDLRIPFVATSTDLTKGEAVFHDQGDLIQAVLASMSLPGFTPPIGDGQRLLVDGSLLVPLPGEILKQKGADLVIGVDLTSFHPSSRWNESPETPGALSILGRAWDVQNRELALRQMEVLDLIVRPGLTEIGLADFDAMEFIFSRGVEAGEQAVPKIRALIKSFNQSHRRYN